MEKDKEINLRQYAPKRAPFRYLIRVIIYIILLGATAYTANYFMKRSKAVKSIPVKEIDHFEIESDSLL